MDLSVIREFNWKGWLIPCNEVPALGIRSLDYLNLMENKLGVLWANDVPGVAICWKKQKKRNKFIQQGPVDTCANMRGNICFHPGYWYPFEYLCTSDLNILLSKKSELEMCLWFGHLFDELCSNLLRAENKVKAANLILKVTERALYIKYHSDFTIEENLVKILQILEDVHSSFEIPTYAKIVVDLLKLFCVREPIVTNFIKCKELNFSKIIQSARYERFEFFGLWGHKNNFYSNHKNDLYSDQLIDNCLIFNQKAALAMLLHGGVNKFTETSYELFKNCFIGLHSSVFNREEKKTFEEKLESIVKEKKTHHRCFQMYLIIRCIFCERTWLHPVLQLLWNTISDPFLTRNDFESIAAITSNESSKDLLLRTWNHYSYYLNLSDDSLKKPRMLQYLAGATVREALSTSFNYPNGIEELCLPPGSKQYVYISAPESMQ